MTVLQDARLALAALLDAATDVKVSAYPLGENEPPRECVYLDGSDCRFEWRSIGAAAKNRTEEIGIEIVVRAYREAPSQTDAAAAALGRVEDLLEVVEGALVTDPAGAFTVGDTLTMARVGEWTVRSVPRESGWSAEGRARLTATNHP